MLSPNVVPVNYKIDFDVDMEALSFSGHEAVEIEIKKPCGSFILNTSELKIKKCSVNSKSVRFLINEEKEELTIKFNKKTSGNVILEVEFGAPLQGGLAGFYKSSYNTKEGKKYLATTQFEPADARRAFPCFDEPAMKSTFDISITTGKSLKAISNMPVKKEDDAGSKKKTVFFTTPKMSTYLVYLGVGDFEFLTDKSKGVEIRFVAVNGKSNHGKFALECAKKILAYYNKYFGIEYPLSKIDLIALPDFASGAMENWGAITFREVELFFDPKINSAARKQRIVEIIAHELAHQWFGNLVTMKWWNNLWLNESFATWMSFKATDELFPEWRIWEQFAGSTTTGAFYLDALKSSHPIEVNVEKPHELNEIFDSISYNKGASLIRMIENYLGKDVFRQGVAKYIEDNKYSNAETNDLWDALSHASKIDVKKIMNSWVKITGYPVLYVKKEGTNLIIKQKRFLYLSKKRQKRTSTSKASVHYWKIPIKIHSDVKDISIVMNSTSAKINLGKPPNYYVVNYGKTGFYRTMYDCDNINALKKAISRNKLSIFDKWGIQNDLFAFCRAGKMKFKKYLDFIEVFLQDKDFLVCKDVSDHLYKAYTLSNGELRGEIKLVATKFYKNIIERLGFDPVQGESENSAILRASVLISFCRMGNKDVVAEAKKRFEKRENLHPDIRSAVYFLVAWQGDKNTYDNFFEMYRNTDIPEEKRRLMAALASFSDIKLLKETIDLAFSEHVKSQDLPILLARLFENTNSTQLAWQWTKDNWDMLEKCYGNGGNVKLLEKIVDSLAVFDKETYKKDVVKFFKKRKRNHINKSLNQALESIDINVQFAKLNS